MMTYKIKIINVSFMIIYKAFSLNFNKSTFGPELSDEGRGPTQRCEDSSDEQRVQ